MKRKFADRPGWKRVPQKRFYAEYLHSPEFTGFVTAFLMDVITEPLVVEFKDQQFCIVDKGFTWLQYFPVDAHYVATAMFDAEDEIVQWYIDICKQWGLDKRWIPWYDDLYLDIAIAPSGETWVLDADELDAALQEGKISQAEYEFAWRETSRLVTEIERGEFKLLEMSKIHLSMLKYQENGHLNGDTGRQASALDEEDSA